MRVYQLLAAIIASASPLSAQDEICGTDFDIENLVGNYTLQVGNAMMFGVAGLSHWRRKARRKCQSMRWAIPL
jgi:hypothetical protein